MNWKIISIWKTVLREKMTKMLTSQRKFSAMHTNGCSSVVFTLQRASITWKSHFFVQVYSLFIEMSCSVWDCSCLPPRNEHIRSGCRPNSSLHNSVPPSLYLLCLCVLRLLSFLIELSGASSGEDIEVAKVCSLIGMSHICVCVCFVDSVFFLLQDSSAQVTHAALSQ